MPWTFGGHTPGRISRSVQHSKSGPEMGGFPCGLRCKVLKFCVPILILQRKAQSNGTIVVAYHTLFNTDRSTLQTYRMKMNSTSSSSNPCWAESELVVLAARTLSPKPLCK